MQVLISNAPEREGENKMETDCKEIDINLEKLQRNLVLALIIHDTLTQAVQSARSRNSDFTYKGLISNKILYL